MWIQHSFILNTGQTQDESLVNDVDIYSLFCLTGEDDGDGDRIAHASAVGATGEYNR